MILRGEVWLVDLGEPGDGGPRIGKCRPCIVISADGIGRLPLRLIVPLTSWHDRFLGSSWVARLPSTETNGLRKVSAADCFQIRSVPVDMFIKRMGVCSNEEMADVIAAVQIVIDAL